MRRCAVAPARTWSPRRSRARQCPRRTSRARQVEMNLSGRFEWPVVMLFVILAAISRSPALIVLAAGGLVVWLVVWLTARVALVALDVQAEVAPDRVVAGEALVATVRIANRKPLPLPWLDLRLLLPAGFEPPNAGPPRARGPAGKRAPRA